MTPGCTKSAHQHLMMDLRMFVMASLTGGLAGISYLIWKKAIKPSLSLLYYDIRLLSALSAGMNSSKMNRNHRTIADVFEATVRDHPNKVFIIFEGVEYTYSYVDKMATKVANLMLSLGVKRGDDVALLLTNCPQFAWIFLGLSKIGAIPSFQNYNLQSFGLIHSIQTINPKLFIIDSDATIQANIENIKDQLDKNLDIYVACSSVNNENVRISPFFKSFDKILSTASIKPIHPSMRDLINKMSISCYIYTSGTTGLPKACNIYNVKLLGAVRLSLILGINSSDVLYVTLPMYHSSGLFLGLNIALSTGATVVLKRKFSASSFWKDCCQYQVTVASYIGELCRYILAQRFSEYESYHKLRLLYGNGLSKDIWRKFQKRFQIPKIVEFFGATEGSALLINFENRVGAVGRISPLLNWLIPSKTILVKYDPDSVEPLRDAKGRCILVNQGETGLLLGEILPVLDKKLYKGESKLENLKIVRDVIKPGDKYFNFGDLLYQDKDYFVYFKDRLGETFRWKGENVATEDVASVLRELDFIEEVSVYGVLVPGCEGRAGMASLKLKTGDTLHHTQLKDVFEICQKKLASYSIPLFLRVQKEMPITGTFKYQKSVLKEEGFDPNLTSDSLYFMDSSLKHYVPLLKDIYYQIVTGKVRL